MSTRHTIIGTGIMLSGLLGMAVTGTKSCDHFNDYGISYRRQVGAVNEDDRQRFESQANDHITQSGKWAVYFVASAIWGIAGLLYRRRGAEQ